MDIYLEVFADEENPRKVQKIVGQEDVRNNASGDSGSAAPPSDEWKLVLCHASGRISFDEVESLFSHVVLRGIRKGVVYGERTAVEVSFWTEADMHKALEDSSSSVDFQNEGISLKRTDEALQEMTLTEDLWRSLPAHLMDEISTHLAPLVWGRLFTRVGRKWKQSIERAQDSCGGVLIVPEAESPHRGPNPCESAEPCRLGSDITHLVLFSPGKAKNIDNDDDDENDGKADWTRILKVNRQIKKLTFVREDHLLDVSNMQFGLAAPPFEEVWKFIETFVCVDSFLLFSFGGRYELAKWTVAVYVPRLELTVPKFSHRKHSEKQKDFVGQIMTNLESLDSWWPYPAEQTEWLRNSLNLISEEQRADIDIYLVSPTRRLFRLSVKGTAQLTTDLTSSAIIYEGHLLDKRDCAVIGHYLCESENLDVEGPPCDWKNTHFILGPVEYTDVEIYKDFLDEIRSGAKLREVTDE